MSNVQFDSDNEKILSIYSDTNGNNVNATKSGLLTKIFVKLGIVKNESQAPTVLIIIMLINFTIASLIVYYFIL